MKSKTFVILLVICAVLGAVAYFTVVQRGSQDNQGKMGEKLLPDFPVNEVAKITIKSPEASLTLNKGETVWEVEDKFNYPADFSKLADFVKQLRDTKIGRQFRADEEKISRLGLNPPDKADLPEEQKGSRITLSDKENKPLADVILGKSREGGGHYVMLAGSSEIAMVDQNFQFIDKKPDEWLDKELMKVPAADVEKIVCLDPKTDTPLYTLKRPEKGKEPEFVNPPEGKKIKKAKINSLFGALASFRIDSVGDPSTEAAGAIPEEGPVFVYHLFDGTVYKVYPGNALKDDEEKYYFKTAVSFSAPEKKTEETEEATAEETEKEAQPEPEEAEKSESELAAEATSLNEKFSPWTYIISKWRKDNFVADAEEFFEEVKAEDVKEEIPGAEEAEPESEASEISETPEVESADGEAETPESETDAATQEEAVKPEAETPYGEAETPESETDAATQEEAVKPEAETPAPKTADTQEKAEQAQPETNADTQAEAPESDTGKPEIENETPSIGKPQIE
jgi:hypothetical protein